MSQTCFTEFFNPRVEIGKTTGTMVSGNALDNHYHLTLHYNNVSNFGKNDTTTAG